MLFQAPRSEYKLVWIIKTCTILLISVWSSPNKSKISLSHKISCPSGITIPGSVQMCAHGIWEHGLVLNTAGVKPPRGLFQP